MKKLAVLLLLLFTYSLSYAFNGKDWIQLEKLDKIMFLNGFFEHVNNPCYNVDDKGNVIRPTDTYSMMSNIDMLNAHMFRNYTFSEIVNLFDNFYGEPDNRGIHFGEAFFLISVKISPNNDVGNNYQEKLIDARRFYDRK